MDQRRVMCFGDSNTHGSPAMHHPDDQRRFGPDVRWPCVMGKALGAGWSVVEEGHGGRTTTHDDPIAGEHRNGLRMLLALMESHRPLDLVIIMLGTNDLKGCFNVSAFDIAESAGRLVTEVRNSICGPERKAPKVLLVCPPPVIETGFLAEPYHGSAAKSLQMPTRFSEMTTRRSIPYFDAGSVEGVVADPVDGVHLTEAAQIALGAAMAQEVRRLFP